MSASKIAPSNPAHPKWHDPLNRVLNVKSFNIYIFQIFHQSHFWCPSVCSQVVAQMMDIIIVPRLWNMIMVDLSGRLIFWSLKIHQTFSGIQNFYVWNDVIQIPKYLKMIGITLKHFHHEINENLNWVHFSARAVFRRTRSFTHCRRYPIKSLSEYFLWMISKIVSIIVNRDIILYIIFIQYCIQ